MTKKQAYPVRIHLETKVKLDSIKKALIGVEQVPISNPEILRRTFNIATLPDVLVKDAVLKKEKRLKGI